MREESSTRKSKKNEKLSASASFTLLLIARTAQTKVTKILNITSMVNCAVRSINIFFAISVLVCSYLATIHVPPLW